MEKAPIQPIQRIIGVGLIIVGFLLIVIIFNPQGLMIPTSDRVVVWLIFCIIGEMIGLGAYLASGFASRAVIEILLISGLCIILIIPILSLPLSEDMYGLVLGFTPFLGLLLWISYTKLKSNVKKHKTD